MANKKDLIHCPLCKGSGVVVCPACNGSGKTEDSICHVCNGTGLVKCYYCSGRARISSKGDLEVEVSGTDSKDVETVASTLLEKVAKHRPARIASLWISGSFYLFVFAVVIAVCLGVAKLVPFVAIPIVLLAGILVVSVIGAFQLRQDKKLSQRSFLELMALTFKYLPLLKATSVRNVVSKDKKDVENYR